MKYILAVLSFVSGALFVGALIAVWNHNGPVMLGLFSMFGIFALSALCTLADMPK